MASRLLSQSPGEGLHGPTNRGPFLRVPITPLLRPTVVCQAIGYRLTANPLPAALAPPEPLRGMAKTAPLSSFPATLTQKQGVPLLVIPIPLGLTVCKSPPPFTAHSQSCYRPFTHPSPSLVTINPSQGTNSYTMPIVNTRPTVHFYRCDPPREIRS